MSWRIRLWVYAPITNKSESVLLICSINFDPAVDEGPDNDSIFTGIPCQGKYDVKFEPRLLGEWPLSKVTAVTV